MKVYIEYEFTDDPWGGANQFLRNLRQEFISLGCYTESALNADIILFNSHHNPHEIINLHRSCTSSTFVHRVDGPMSLYNSENDGRDSIVYILNESIASATVFQAHGLKTKTTKWEWAHLNRQPS